MKTLTLLALASLALTAPALASPGEHGDAAPHAELLLRAIDIPLTPDTIEHAGLTEAVAARVALDLKQKRYTRVRALGALGVFGSDLGRRLIESAAVADPDEQVRVQAVISLARVWGPADRPTVSAFLVDRLADESAAVGDAVLRELERLYQK